MATRYANQKQITINKMEVPEKDFFIMGTSSLDKAAYTLTGNGFKLYYYLMNNAAGFKLNLSSKDVSSRTGLKESSYYAAVKELTEKGYLVQPDPTVNNWVMNEVAEQVAEQETMEN